MATNPAAAAADAGAADAPRAIARPPPPAEDRSLYDDLESVIQHAAERALEQKEYVRGEARQFVIDFMRDGQARLRQTSCVASS